MQACAGWSRPLEEHHLQQSAAAAAVGDVPNHPEPVGRLFPKRRCAPGNGQVRYQAHFPREGANISIVENGALEAVKVRTVKKHHRAEFYPLPKFGGMLRSSAAG